MTIKCVKGSAFNAAQLFALTYSSSPNPTFAERFQSIPLTCSRLGDWIPVKGDQLPACNGDVIPTALSFYENIQIFSDPAH
jgi:hypothetical protein